MVYESHEAYLANKHDIVVDGTNNCLCVRQVRTTGGSLDMQNDWLWIPTYRSRAAMQLGAVNIHNPVVIELEDQLRSTAQVLLQLTETVCELKKEIESLRAG